MPRSLIALVLCAGFGPSAEPFLKAPSPEQLTRQLGAPEFATREQASESLRALGAAALPAVQRATTSDDPEIRRRALALLPAIQARIAFTPVGSLSIRGRSRSPQPWTHFASKPATS
ncbi:hypothetical protein R5W23_002537 [Gemmata sp. JC673]|uniref:HEAT repeat domain-containing protein n=1 Tax=Gemmata algarum TaxID=2975278 RepID=A0ABU5F106_9BACT|nr:hypothetical protein [Gemmata algarum]MDY3561262.1 hypothetical protein [Gemmata algarum]